MSQVLRLFLPLVMTILLMVAAVRAEEEDESPSMDEVVLALESFTSNCDPVPTKEHMVEMISNKRDAAPETKCLRYCLMDQFNVVKSDNFSHQYFFKLYEMLAWRLIRFKINLFHQMVNSSTQMQVEKTSEFMDMIVPDDKATANDIINKCNEKNAAITDNCEAAHEHSMCMLDELKARKIKVPEVKS